jgi:hypothetical protein
MTDTQTVKLERGLLYPTKPSVINSILERRQDRILPITYQNLTPGQIIEFTISNDQVIDLQTVVLNLQYTNVDNAGATVATAGKGYLNSATDLISNITVSYNDKIVEQFNNANYWTNTYLYHYANPGFFQGDGSALMGTCPFKYYSVHPKLKNTYVSIPMCIISPFFRMQQFLPLMGAKLRVQVTLAPARDVLSEPASATDTYKISDSSVLFDTVLLQDAYLAGIKSAISGPKGILLPYCSFLTNEMQATATTTNIIRWTHNTSNAISVHVLRSPEAVKIEEKDKISYASHSFPITDLTSFECKVGSRYFTPPDGIKSYAELFRASQLTISSLNNVQGSGIVDRPMMTDTYTQDASSATAKSGLCVLSCNLERTLEQDDGLINSGISSGNGNEQIHVVLKTTGALNATDKFYMNVVHKRALKLASSGVEVLQ